MLSDLGRLVMQLKIMNSALLFSLNFSPPHTLAALISPAQLSFLCCATEE